MGESDKLSERELLEAAAKAAAYEFDAADRWRESGGPALWLTKTRVWWNPLVDDGDAFRLAVKLELSVSDNGEFVMVDCCNNHGLAITVRKGSDPYAATRLAITRAAAALTPRSKT